MNARLWRVVLIRGPARFGEEGVRHVPLIDAVLPLVKSMTAGKGPNDLLVTTGNGARLYATAFRHSTH